ncbi:hypothetical protein GUH81_19130 [Xanthomonas citri pv. citri]|nr:hypothetical protein [Xanthomonas citri pv. citri]MBD1530822.1 hypothetical protein [Xanthomonas citri pv. citri]MBD1534046.1 hypothetical protein [Xanthomonas citri pv. citri]
MSVLQRVDGARRKMFRVIKASESYHVRVLQATLPFDGKIGAHVEPLLVDVGAVGRYRA